MKLTHVLEAQQFDREWLEKKFFPLAVEMEKVVNSAEKKYSWTWFRYLLERRSLSGKQMLTFFYEPSTRTRISFEMAMRYLGGNVIATDHAKIFSSVAKGETIEDTFRVLSGYKPDVVVLRSDQEGMAKRAAQFSSIPIINAGDGMGQHPTQALLDIFTIWKELGRIDGLTVAMVGDLARGRTVRSLSYLLGKFYLIRIYYVSPPELRMKDDIRKYLKRHNVWYREESDLRKVAPEVDVIYQTRIQKERGDLTINPNEGFFVVNPEILALMPKHAIIMHPLPRVDEITSEVDPDPRAAYFRQAKNGLYVRMALLKMILG